LPKLSKALKQVNANNERSKKTGLTYNAEGNPAEIMYLNKKDLTTIGDLFTNANGVIVNILHEPINSVAVIYCKKDTERSNHYHKTDSHYLYVLEGEMEYYEREIDDKDHALYTKVLKGQMVFTDSMLVHQTKFRTDTILLSLATKKRDHKNHEKDVVREKF
jgi:quercetin dioxygenase-like cupin family protein